MITTAIVSALYFGGHLEHGRHMMKMTEMIPMMLDKSRFCRRLHKLEGLICSLFFQIGHQLKAIAGASDYVIDSFPVAVCDNIRISRSKMFCKKCQLHNTSLKMSINNLVINSFLKFIFATFIKK